MKTTIKSILTLALVMGFGIWAHAQKTSSAPASATVLSDLSITLDGTQNEIAFGTLSATTPAAVVLDANGSAGNANTGTVTNVARFDIAGNNSAITINYDASVNLTNGTPSVDMIMTPEVVGATENTAQAAAGAVLSGAQRTLVDNKYYLWVGGTIPALDAQVTGSYTGTFNVNVEYN